MAAIGLQEWLGIVGLIVAVLGASWGWWRWQTRRFDALQKEINGGLASVRADTGAEVKVLASQLEHRSQWLTDKVHDQHVETIERLHKQQLEAAEKFATIAYLRDVEGRVTARIESAFKDMKGSVDRLTARLDGALQSQGKGPA